MWPLCCPCNKALQRTKKKNLSLFDELQRILTSRRKQVVRYLLYNLCFLQVTFAH